MKAARCSALAPFEVEGGENPYTIQQDLQQSMNDLVGIIRTGEELEQSLEEIEAFKERAKTMVVEGHRQYNPGWHLAHRPAQHADRLRGDREGRAGPRGVPRRPHPRRLPEADHEEWGKKNLVVTLDDSGDGVVLTEKPLPEMPDELKKYFEERLDLTWATT